MVSSLTATLVSEKGAESSASFFVAAALHCVNNRVLKV